MNTDWIERLRKIADDAVLPVGRAKQLQSLALKCSKNRAIDVAFWEFEREKRQQLLVQIALASLGQKFSDAERSMMANALEKRGLECAGEGVAADFRNRSV